jgi:hypothetical protein
MAERRENSVLFSLRELRTIEEDRVKGEEEAEKARIAAEIRAREEAERQRREAEEAKIRAEQERVRQNELEKERIAHDAQVRLQEAERRAQIEAGTRLEQARIEADARARMDAKKFPTGMVVAGVGGLVVVAGIVMGILVHNHNVELAQQQAELQRQAKLQADEIKKAADAQAAALKKELDGLQAALDKTQDEAERNKIRAQMAAASHAATKSSGGSKTAKSDSGSTPAAPAKPKIKVGESNDPLQGLGL